MNKGVRGHMDEDKMNDLCKKTYFKGISHGLSAGKERLHHTPIILVSKVKIFLLFTQEYPC